jgi:5-methyltetrahydropteroyltriglutamate--homocysteine methyltransferase
MKPDQRVFIGVIDPIDPRIESPHEVQERILEAAAIYSFRTIGNYG